MISFRILAPPLYDCPVFYIFFSSFLSFSRTVSPTVPPTLALPTITANRNTLHRTNSTLVQNLRQNTWHRHRRGKRYAALPYTYYSQSRRIPPARRWRADQVAWLVLLSIKSRYSFVLRSFQSVCARKLRLQVQAKSHIVLYFQSACTCELRHTMHTV